MKLANFIPKKVISILSLLLVVELTIGMSIDKKTSLQRGTELLERHPLIDGHNDLSLLLRKQKKNQFATFDFEDMSSENFLTHTDIKRIKQGKMGGQFWSIYSSCASLAKDAVRLHLEAIDTIKRLVDKYPDSLQLATTSEDIADAFKNKKLASLMGMESAHAIDSSLSILRIFYSLGVRYMTLTHNCNVPWATNNKVDGLSNPAQYGGLTSFGNDVIREMNRLGMIADLSHVSLQTMRDTLAVSKSPVMFSHSSVYAIAKHNRNVRDEILLKLKENNGIIMINFYPYFIKSGGKNVKISDVVKHFNYVKELLGGVDNIGIGGDYDGIEVAPLGLEDVSKYPNLFAALIDDGWTEEELAKVANKNIIRVLKANEDYAKSVASTQEPINTIIPQKDLGSTTCRTRF